MTPILTIADLRKAGRNLTAPFRFALEAVTLPREMEILEIHRLLPGKRLTARARWCGMTVLVKLFFDRSGYKRHWHREAAGLSALLRANLPTPRILAQAENGSLRAAAIITEYLADARTLADLPPQSAELAEAMASTLALLARLHGAGLEQRDIHPGNFLWCGGKIHLIDGDAIASHETPLASEAAAANLGLFLAQFPPSLDSEPAPLIHYGENSGIGADALERHINQQRNKRWRVYREKLLRDCTEIRCENHWSGFLAVRRDEEDEHLRDLLKHIDRYIAGAELLKDGNSSTVARVQLVGRCVVVKRYNIKDWRHRLSRFWRPTRAQRSWINAHHLRFLGIATPPPIAYLERRAGPLRGVAYYVSARVAGETLATKLQGNAVPEIMAPVARLLRQLFHAQIAHGDMKASNILCYPGRPHLVDLDAMNWLPDKRRFLKRYRKDRQRFLDNWPKDSPARAWFDAHLPPKAGV